MKIFFKKQFIVKLWDFYLTSEKVYKLQSEKKLLRLMANTSKDLLKKFKEERDRIENETGIRPQIDDTTQMFMQKILNVWISEGKKIDEEKFWLEVDYYRQFTHSVEYFEIKR